MEFGPPAFAVWGWRNDIKEFQFLRGVENRHQSVGWRIDIKAWGDIEKYPLYIISKSFFVNELKLLFLLCPLSILSDIFCISNGFQIEKFRKIEVISKKSETF